MEIQFNTPPEKVEHFTDSVAKVTVVKVTFPGGAFMTLKLPIETRFRQRLSTDQPEASGG